MMRRVFTSVLGLSVLCAGTAAAQLPNEDLMCRPDTPTLDKYAYLRALSLDLRGTVPSPAEYRALDSQPDVPEGLIDSWLGSEAFVQRAVRAHRGQLWNNIDNVRIVNYRANMRTTRMSGDLVYWRTQQAQVYRGIDRPPCADEPARYDDDGNLLFTVGADGMRREGWVRVEPYWAPGTQIKVCAADAQDTLISPTGTSCGTNSGYNDTACGCGPNLQWCINGYPTALQQAMARDVELRVAALVRENRPYTELFTSRRAFVNGPLVHYLRHQIGLNQGIRMDPVAYDMDRLPNIPFTDYSFHEIELPAEHAGILTSPAFLLRFQTNRARANRFFDSFLCSPPSPPPGGLPTADPNARVEPDLQKRDGCKYCHALLEPAAAHWGRWTERGAGFLAPELFPARRADCEQCGRTGQACSQECRLYYVTNTFTPEEEAFVGALSSYQFLRADHERNVEMGPRLLVLTSIVDDRFPTCISQRTVEGMVGRELDAEETEWAGSLARDFLASGYRYRDLVKSIVTSDIYRRVR